MATGAITLDTGSTLNTTTYTILEDAVVKHIPRSSLNASDGTEIGTIDDPLVVSPSGGTITSITNAVTITGSVISLGTTSTTVLGTCSTTLLGTSGCVVIGVVTITGSTVVLGTCSTVVLGTCSTTILGTSGCVVIGAVTVTGSTGVVNYGLQPGRFKGQLNSANVTGATTVVAAVSNATSYISAYMISAAVAGMYWLEDSAATALTPMHHLAATGGVSFTAVEGMPIASAITNTTIALKSSVVGSVGCLVLGYTA